MAEPVRPPAQLAHLVDLASDTVGGFVLYATDDYFAPKENLLKPSAPIFLEGEYTDRGKWMDGWESQRRREPGHDSCIVRLGLPGSIHGLVVDTTHFKGNAPEACALEIIAAPPNATAKQLLASDGWQTLLERAPLQPHFANVFTLAPSPRATHVRLRIYPDGGVARLRVYGVVQPEPRVYWLPGSVDLAAVENGGTIAAVSDEFFGPPANLLLPGRGTNMGDGWETKRRRTPGSDWCVIALGRRGVVERVRLDTHFFKGNAPQAVLVEAIDAEGLSAGELAARLKGSEPWPVLIDETPLEPHKRHELHAVRELPLTHVRVHIFPHGGVNRLRLFGYALDGAAERAKLEALDHMKDDEARALLASLCGSRAFADMLLGWRPYPSVRTLFAAAQRALWQQSEADWLEAFAAHPRLGEREKAKTQTETSAQWSRGEQSGASGAEPEVLARLAELNERYYEKHGFIFICFATGKTAADMLTALEARLPRERALEIETAAREQARITMLRLEKWLLGL